jgi:hypothetical protein
MKKLIGKNKGSRFRSDIEKVLITLYFFANSGHFPDVHGHIFQYIIKPVEFTIISIV